MLSDWKQGRELLQDTSNDMALLGREGFRGSMHLHQSQERWQQCSLLGRDFLPKRLRMSARGCRHHLHGNPKTHALWFARFRGCTHEEKLCRINKQCLRKTGKRLARKALQRTKGCRCSVDKGNGSVLKQSENSHLLLHSGKCP